VFYQLRIGLVQVFKLDADAIGIDFDKCFFREVKTIGPAIGNVAVSAGPPD